MERSIIQFGSLSEAQKLETAEIFIDGFGHFMTFTKDRNVLSSLVLHSINPLYTYVLVEGETVVGMLGIATNKVRPFKLEQNICINLFGKMKGNLLCKQLNAIFQSQVVKNDTDLYIDFLATSRQHERKGVATELLKFSFDLQGFEDYYIEVMSKNTKAKSLYEKIGFEVYKTSRFSPLSLSGYGYPIKMKLIF